MPTRIAVLTTTRADYGILTSVLRAIESEPDAELLLVVTGTHLMERHGATVAEIERDGFPIWYRIPLDDDADDSPASRVRATAAIATGISDAFSSSRPDWLVVLGDRFEILGAAHAAVLHGIPVAHIHGGEVTEGAIDDSIRHAVTKLARLHFVAADDFARRVRQLGEEDGRVIVSGAPALDDIGSIDLLDRDDLATEIGFSCRARSPS